MAIRSIDIIADIAIPDIALARKINQFARDAEDYLLFDCSRRVFRLGAVRAARRGLQPHLRLGTRAAAAAICGSRYTANRQHRHRSAFRPHLRSTISSTSSSAARCPNSVKEQANGYLRSALHHKDDAAIAAGSNSAGHAGPHPRCGGSRPNGGNTQRWHFVAVDDPQLKREFAQLFRRARALNTKSSRRERDRWSRQRPMRTPPRTPKRCAESKAREITWLTISKKSPCCFSSSPSMTLAAPTSIRRSGARCSLRVPRASAAS
ncbi:putative nitroreductase [Mycobacterium xenopi 4042]|uniref:Putative nitroreductase n=1 Tax=Mycobacterium xenopi 4042 TaxID=1299334 RepID=X8BFZ8_MYCXE|nr:putative nitroreductase [Mycobacterium xenopi 4042]